ncbi:AlpA family phage regulatory protein [Thalassotalea psychrophila]|uniref:AlpA family phage regulatory protein n=1 Tax=Thalassotalea psychrophila TaxID=3065647 RepID=A0ABY9TW30_9GAMM|nr:AlpA family phage regulatory protein [Colwelliaceae bacterium SQ149]
MKQLHTQHETHNTTQQEKFLRISSVVDLVGLSRATILRLEKDKKFPKAIRITTRCVAYRLSQIHDWMSDPLNFEVG